MDQRILDPNTQPGEAVEAAPTSATTPPRRRPTRRKRPASAAPATAPATETSAPQPEAEAPQAAAPQASPASAPEAAPAAQMPAAASTDATERPAAPHSRRGGARRSRSRRGGGAPDLVLPSPPTEPATPEAASAEANAAEPAVIAPELIDQAPILDDESADSVDSVDVAHARTQAAEAQERESATATSEPAVVPVLSIAGNPAEPLGILAVSESPRAQTAAPAPDATAANGFAQGTEVAAESQQAEPAPPPSRYRFDRRPRQSASETSGAGLRPERLSGWHAFPPVPAGQSAPESSEARATREDTPSASAVLDELPQVTLAEALGLAEAPAAHQATEEQTEEQTEQAQEIAEAQPQLAPQAAAPLAEAPRQVEIPAAETTEAEEEEHAEDHGAEAQEGTGGRRRRRRRRSSTGTGNQVMGAIETEPAEEQELPARLGTAATRDVAESYGEMAARRAPENGYHAVYEDFDEPYAAYAPDYAEHDRARSEREPQQPWDITTGQQQINRPSSPFSSPEPSFARGFGPQPSGVAGPARESYPRTGRSERGLDAPPMSANQLGTLITQAISRQTDRLLAEMRHQQNPPSMTVMFPPFPSTERVGVFVDVANLLYSARSMRINIDFGRLLDFLRGNRRLIRAQAYAPTNPDPRADQQFLSAVKGVGYRITTKNYKTFASGAKKADMDLDLCMDIVRMVDAKAIDTLVLVSGDSDFLPLLEYCSDHGVRVEVAAFDDSASMILRQSCDLFINLSLVEDIRL